MKSKYKAIIYPFDVEAIPLIRHNNLIDNYDIVQAISPSGWGLEGKDASFADNGEPTGIIVDSDFDKALESCDAVFFINSSTKIDLDKFIYPKIIKAAQNSKNIICTIKLENRVVDEISKICTDKNTSWKYFENTCNNIKTPTIEKIYKINTPIIFVTGIGERTHKFEIQLNLKENLKKTEYRVSQIGTRHYCELMGFHSFPKFMYSKAISESEKVILFNHYIKNIEIKENPDIIIVGVPGGTMPFSYEFPNKFGILAYEISQAVLPDAVVLSTLYNDYTSEYFELISKSYRYKFGYDIDCYNISNLIVDLTASNREEELKYLMLDYQFINEKKKNHSSLGTPVYNILDIDDAKSMSDFLINKLTRYGQSQII
ncbi:TIGR04066 family peptide maturation system protein [Clostridium beijerinckii]|uniref:TIGR04066 family peptide maturation system protein n=1 Tax=Clostridium beijerinckii TaxID=1520 RepID=UPI001494947F|nr:TIGR04066 family peptide maturation system protein [Clostridium beijerinckii]NOW07172.1 peptide maturation system protein (TIGR04066 family) [Clostridium beijerinckii]NYC05054.1 peptide maturation system protein (TIGR04066 family) [Clostridium beijerinckii]